jgi:hypothetical protein
LPQLYAVSRMQFHRFDLNLLIALDTLLRDLIVRLTL